MQRDTSRRQVFAFIVGAVMAFGALAQAQSDPFSGTWELNVAKSQFVSPGAGVRSRTLTITPKGDMFSHVQETYRQGNDAVTKIVFDAKYDGSDAPVTGAAFGTVSFTRMGRTMIRKAKRLGMEVETATYTLSADGKILTIVTKGDNYGVMYSSTQVFEKKM
jgi:hypothetical protein